MVDSASVLEDSLVIQSLQDTDGSIIDGSNNFYANTSTVFIGNSTSSVTILPSGISTPTTTLTDVFGTVSINTTSLSITGSSSNLYMDAYQASFPGSLEVGTALILDGEIIINQNAGNVGDVLSSNSTTVYWSSAANNATNLGGIAAANYVQNTDSRTLSGNITFSSTNTYFSVGAKFGTTTVANTLGFFTSATVNSASFTSGANFIANASGVYTTGTVNAATVTLGSYGSGISVQANSTSLLVGNSTYYSLYTQNSLVTYSATIKNTNGSQGVILNTDSGGNGLIQVTASGANISIANGSGLYLTNNKGLYFQTVNTGAYVSFIQQNDDNFVFYTTNASYGQRAVFAIYANNNSSNLNILAPLNPQGGIVANNSLGTTGQFLTSNGSAIYWSSAGGASVNVGAQYSWTNTQTFSANISFTGNNISVVNGTGSIMFNGASDTNWRIGRDTNSVTKYIYTNNTLDFISGGSNLEGFTFGSPAANTFLEIGGSGTYTKLPIYVGNSTVNVTINSTSFSGSANNASYLGGTAASGYQSTAGLSANVATLAANAATYLNGKTESNLNVNSALTSNAATYLNGKTEGNLNVNSALTANSASYLGSTAAANYLTNTGSFTISGVHTHNANLVVATSAGISANGSYGTNGQVLTSNGSTVYWANSSGGGGSFSNGSSISVNNFAVTGSFTANGSTGSTGQILTTSGNSTYWGNASTLTLYYANGSVAFLGSGQPTGFANGSSISVGTLVLTSAVTANSSNGTSGQVLTSNGSAAYWSNVSSQATAFGYNLLFGR